MVLNANQLLLSTGVGSKCKEALALEPNFETPHNVDHLYS